MITSVFLNLIYVLFPISCYFIYIIYSKVTYEKEKNLFFVLATFTSVYLCSRFGVKNWGFYLIINTPFILSLQKKNLISNAFLSIFLSYELSSIYDLSIVIFLVKYFTIILLVYVAKCKTINAFLIIHVISDVFMIVLLDKMNVVADNYAQIITSWIGMYILLYLIILFYKKIEKLINMYHSLEDITREKTLYQSLFKITHEIKNPLAVCKGYLEMFDIKNPSKANKYIGIINQEIDRTLVLLKDFSDVSKIKVEKNQMDINMLIEDVCEEAKMILKNNISFKYELFANNPMIEGDYNRLKQVLINVIKNAKEAITEKGKVTLICKNNKNECVISIKDSGKGMDKETKQKIGTPFYTTKKNGTGLGVCFSKEIIQLHSGTMKYYSKENKGTEVRITLPLKRYA